MSSFWGAMTAGYREGRTGQPDEEHHREAAERRARLAERRAALHARRDERIAELDQERAERLAVPREQRWDVWRAQRARRRQSAGD